MIRVRFARPCRGTADCAVCVLHQSIGATLILLLVTAALLVLLGLVLLGLQWHARQRQVLLVRLLDRTDALESVLQATRKRMNAMKSVVQRVPSDIGAVAQASLDADTPVQQGLRNVLEHRLWIAHNAATASIAELRRAVDALDRSHSQIALRLKQLDDAGAELAEATRPVLEQQAREPAALRRADPDHDPNSNPDDESRS